MEWYTHVATGVLPLLPLWAIIIYQARAIRSLDEKIRKIAEVIERNNTLAMNHIDMDKKIADAHLNLTIKQEDIERRLNELIFNLLRDKNDKVLEQYRPRPYDNNKRLQKKSEKEANKESHIESIFPETFKDIEPIIVPKPVPKKIDTEKYLTMKEAAEFAKVTDVTIYTWRKQDKIKSYLVDGMNGFFYKESELLKIMKERK
jgi:hypothetical protein